jgi:hypothetical protein
MLEIVFSKNRVIVVFILCFVVAILLSILEAVRRNESNESIRRWLTIASDCGYLLLNAGIIFFGLWTFYALSQWNTEVMASWRKSMGDSPEWLQRVIMIIMGMMGVVGGVYMTTGKISQIRRGRWSESPPS